MSSHPEDGNLTRISFEVATERAEQVGSYLGHLGVQNLQMEPVEIAPGLRIDRDSEYLSEISTVEGERYTVIEKDGLCKLAVSVFGSRSAGNKTYNALARSHLSKQHFIPNVYEPVDHRLRMVQSGGIVAAKLPDLLDRLKSKEILIPYIGDKSIALLEELASQVLIREIVDAD
jgi:hypothetical protein